MLMLTKQWGSAADVKMFSIETLRNTLHKVVEFYVNCSTKYRLHDQMWPSLRV